MTDTATKPQVIVYSAGWCAFCHAAKDYLDKKGISYDDRDVESKKEFLDESVTKSGQMGIPVLDINGTIIIGFDRPKIDAALAV
jgi:glutaredoxin 3